MVSESLKKIDIEDLASALFDIIKEETVELIEDGDVNDLKELAEDFGKQQYKLLTETDPEKRKEYERNLKHLITDSFSLLSTLYFPYH